MTKKCKTLSDLDKCMAPLSSDFDLLKWYSPNNNCLRLSGFPWYKKDGVYRRLPVQNDLIIPEAVDILAEHTAGGQIAFQTDSTQIAIKVKLAGLADMNHMPSTGQCGFDLYIGEPYQQKFYTSSKYDHRKDEYEVLLFKHSDKKMRSITLNFPLYQGVKDVQIGLAKEANVLLPLPWFSKSRIVIYGTSITQGGCASRPGMAYTNIMSRVLNTEIVNLGFSGNGKGEPSVVKTLANIENTNLFILDYEANSSDTIKDSLPQVIKIIRDTHKNTPIIILSRIAFASDIIHKESLVKRNDNCKMQSALVHKLTSQGDNHLYFIDGSKILRSDYDECTVDGIHPNDLGFMRMAKYLASFIEDNHLLQNQNC